MVNSMPELPTFPETFIPILTVLANEQKGLHRKEIISKLRKQTYADLPPELLFQKTSKRGVNTLSTKIDCALSHLYKAEYVEKPSLAQYKITAKAKQVLKRGSLTLRELKDQPEYSNYVKARGQGPSNENDKSQDAETPLTPLEEIQKRSKEMKDSTKNELRDALKNTAPHAFEGMVLDLLSAMGYGKPSRTKKTRDGGIDGIITEDKLGLGKIYIQAKRFSENKVRAKDIREFIGTIVSGDTNKGIFITTSEFTENAEAQATQIKGANLKLIGGNELVALMYEHDFGVQKEDEVVIKKIDTNFLKNTNNCGAKSS